MMEKESCLGNEIWMQMEARPRRVVRIGLFHRCPLVLSFTVHF